MQDLHAAVKYHLSREFGSSSVRSISGGTLGVCLQADTGSRQFFIKTHQADQASQDNLVKEFELLFALYGHIIRIERFDVQLSSGLRICILMDWLDVSTTTYAPSDVRSIISGCNDTLKNWSIARASQFATFDDLIRDGDRALVELERLKYISSVSASMIRPYFDKLKDAVAELPPVICHGDLSNKNIMLNGNTSIVIDWEDAFVGFKGYDFLYWLTFMDNRKHLSRSIFGYSALDETNERGVLILIVAIKSLISVRTHSVLPSHMPIEQRLLELLAFLMKFDFLID